MRETRSPSMSREDRAEHGMWPGGERDCPLARELDRDRSLVARRIDLDADAHGRARPAIDHDAARALARLSAEQAHPLRLRVLAHPAEARDDERHVVDAGPALREEAVEEPVGAARLEDLEATPVLEAPLRERVGARGSAVRGGSAQLADEERRSVGEARHGERDVIEAAPSHPRLAQDG